MSEAEEPQREITRVALRSLDGTSFVLAGSGAIREHGLVDRPTEDVDLFTSDVDLPRFSSAVDADQLDAIKNRFDVWASTLRGEIPDLDERVERVQRFANLDHPLRGSDLAQKPRAAPRPEDYGQMNRTTASRMVRVVALLGYPAIWLRSGGRGMLAIALSTILLRARGSQGE
ncbi:MAG: nucleotidyl transferase AbiEii/AbiGii toxin family protein [Dermatophilaceae bacterium]